MKRPILDVARVVRSKNSGPFELVLDIMFKDRAVFETVRDTDQITPRRIADLYGLPEDQVKRVIFFPPSLAVKVVMPRQIVSGAPGDSDVYGAQQHAPLLNLEFELP